MVGKEATLRLARGAVGSNSAGNRSATLATNRRTSPASQESVRHHNLALVAGHVVDNGPCSRAQIVRDTGFNKSTVSTLVGDLCALGILAESPAPTRGSIGRPPTLVRVSGDHVAALGLEIGVDYVKVAALDLAGDVRFGETVENDYAALGPEAATTALVELADRALALLSTEGLVAVGVGLGVAGLIDATGQLRVSYDLGWSDVDLVGMVRSDLGRPELAIGIYNEADLAAVGSRWTGVGRGFDNFVYVYGGAAVGAGVILDGQLFEGSHGFGGQFGHLLIDPDGPRCGCGARGCLVAFVGKDAVRDVTGIDSWMAQNPGTARIWLDALMERLRVGDPGPKDAIARVGASLAVGIDALVNLLDPEAIIVGGFLAELLPWMNDAITDHLNARVIGRRKVHYPVLASTQIYDAAVRGGAAVVLTRVLADPASITPLTLN